MPISDISSLWKNRRSSSLRSGIIFMQLPSRNLWMVCYFVYSKSQISIVVLLTKKRSGFISAGYFSCLSLKHSFFFWPNWAWRQLLLINIHFYTDFLNIFVSFLWDCFVSNYSKNHIGFISLGPNVSKLRGRRKLSFSFYT